MICQSDLEFLLCLFHAAVLTWTDGSHSAMLPHISSLKIYLSPGAVSGYEVFPEEGSDGPNTTGDQADPSFGNDKFADDPYKGMFDDQEPGDQNSDHLFDDPDPPAESGGGWGLDNWGDGGDNGDGW